jgi:prevent-host-death family protein
MLKLRGHHLICLHFFRGEGYRAEFTANLGEILKRAETGEQIEVTSEADDVCKICPYFKGEECHYKKESDPEIQGMDREALMLLELTVRDIVLWPDIRKKIPALFHRWSEEFCRACDWRLACGKNAFFRQLSDEKT